jgi:hypothetical protein
MGWMHDFCEYMKLDPYFRKDNHNKMTFAMSYNCAEKYILPLSHDEVVHLKCSMLNKMPGSEFDKFANLRTGLGLEFGLDFHLHVLTAMIFDGCLSSLDSRFEERISVARELEYHRHLIAIDGRLISHHLTIYQILLRASIRYRSQRIHDEFRI